MFSVSEMLAGFTDLPKAIDGISLESFQRRAAEAFCLSFTNFRHYTLLQIVTSQVSNPSVSHTQWCTER